MNRIYYGSKSGVKQRRFRKGSFLFELILYAIINSVDRGPVVYTVNISVLTPDEASAILAGSTPKNLSFGFAQDGFFVAPVFHKLLDKCYNGCIIKY